MCNTEKTDRIVNKRFIVIILINGLNLENKILKS